MFGRVVSAPYFEAVRRLHRDQPLTRRRWERGGESTMAIRACVCALIVMATSMTGANERLSMQVSPEVSFAPANLVIRTRVDPDANNRALEVVADSEECYRSTTIQLEGNRSQRTTTFEFRGLPSGEYEVTAEVIGADGQPRGFARSRLNVLESAASR